MGYARYKDKVEYQRKWNAANKDKLRGYRRKYYAANRDKINRDKRLAYKANPEPHRTKCRQRLQRMTPQQKAQRADRMRAYYIANRERLLAYQAEYRKRKQEKK
jgi:hypothetical protein